MTSNLEPGWYAGDDGRRKYWTGQEWILPAGSGGSPPLEQKSTEPSAPTVSGVEYGDPLRSEVNRRGWSVKCLLIFLSVALVLAGAVWGGYGYYQHREEQARIAAAEAQAQREAEAAEKKRAEEKKKEEQEEQARLEAISKQEEEKRRQRERQQKERDAIDKQFTSGDVGAVFDVVESGSLYFRYLEPSEYSCGYWRCIGVAVVSMKGCSGGVYVEASLLDVNNNVIGYTNARMGALKAEEQGLELLETPNDMTDMFRIEEVNCRR